MSTLALHPLLDTPYAGYAYSYPHKLAYRPFEHARPLADIWRDEPRERVLLYLHVPFCEMRCGFCNLFTQANTREETIAAYLDAAARQARVVRRELGPIEVAAICLGGGTPTVLSPAQLEAVFRNLDDNLQFARGLQQPFSCVETSPATADDERLTVLREHRVQRISIGVQSFVDAEAHAVGRPQQSADVHRALGRIREHRFPILNIDLMCGLPGQDAASWLRSIEAALEYRPEEVYLYPLYVRPLTGLGQLDKSWDDERLTLYRLGRERLLQQGYEQTSMRAFMHRDAPRPAAAYSCQEDATIGLGVGARSYTRSLHYSSRYAVGRRGVASILAHFIDTGDDDFAEADYGIWLTDDEQRRRYLLQGLLQTAGLDRAAYVRRFGADPLADFSELSELEELGMATIDAAAVRLTETGLERSDAIGPWLYSNQVRARIASAELT